MLTISIGKVMISKFYKIGLSLCVIILFSGCAAVSYQPQVWKGDANSVSVTRPAMATSTDTSKIATQHCAQFGKKPSLTKLANPWKIPMRDEFICEVEIQSKPE